MLFDIRMPIGLLFLAIGVMVTLCGLLLAPATAGSAGINIDLVWGLAMTAFGALMLVLAIVSRRRT
jgi:hypothetical protein